MRDGNLLVIAYDNHWIQLVDIKTSGSPSCALSTLAGTGIQGFRNGTCAEAQFSFPCCSVETPDGRIFVTDSGNHQIRCINRKTKEVSTAAGSRRGGGYRNGS